MPLKHDQVEMFLFPALVSALATLIFLSMQQVSALGCDDCDSLVNIDGINIGKIGDDKKLNTEDIKGDDKKLNTEDINKILGEGKTKLENVQGATDRANGLNNDGINGVNNNDDNNKIKIKDLNVLIEDDGKKPHVEGLPNNATVVKIKDFKILIPK
ncbi:MAG TPA: hypothetical protein VJS91_11125 [Nitrososphaeraceae archaeon]|nr:hypothetical protein [Nitrososphaeraceae archaeon]